MEASEPGPLKGRRIAVTRPASRASELCALLEEQGASVLIAPLIAIEDPFDSVPLRNAASDAHSYDWIIFTSANAVRRFAAALAETGSVRIPPGVRTCAVGPATAAALERRGWKADLLPDRYIGEGIVTALMATGNLKGKRVLYPRAEGARPTVAESLRAAGAEVVDIVAYRTVGDESGARLLESHLRREDLDVITFTSGSAVRSFVEALGTEIGSAVIATIGPVTSAIATEEGLPVTIEADSYTAGGLAASIARWYEQGGGEQAQ